MVNKNIYCYYYYHSSFQINIDLTQNKFMSSVVGVGRFIYDSFS